MPKLNSVYSETFMRLHGIPRAQHNLPLKALTNSHFDVPKIDTVDGCELVAGHWSTAYFHTSYPLMMNSALQPIREEGAIMPGEKLSRSIPECSTAVCRSRLPS